MTLYYDYNTMTERGCIMPRKKPISAHVRAVAKYNEQNIRQFILKLNVKTDADVIAVLDSIDGSKQGFIKQLIREYIEKNP